MQQGLFSALGKGTHPPIKVTSSQFSPPAGRQAMVLQWSSAQVQSAYLLV